MRGITIDSPVGPLTVTETDGAITSLWWKAVAGLRRTPVLEQAAEQLDAYFRGRLQHFDLPLAPDGSPFQQRVWQAMCRIPYGETWTYGQMTEFAGGSAQSVGTACGRNPIPVIIPCHRVTAAGGKLGGYSGRGGVSTKQKLLELEGWTGLAPGPLFAAAS